jgi:hypothetical protein
MVLVTAGELELRTLEVQVSSFARKLSVAVRGFHGLHELRHGHIADRSWFSRTLSSSSGTGRSGRPAASLEACSASGCGPAHSSRNAVSAASKGSGEGAVVVHGKTPGERGGREPGPIQPPPIDLAWTCDVPRAGGGSPAVAAAAAAARRPGRRDGRAGHRRLSRPGLLWRAAGQRRRRSRSRAGVRHRASRHRHSREGGPGADRAWPWHLRDGTDWMSLADPAFELDLGTRNPQAVARLWGCAGSMCQPVGSRTFRAARRPPGRTPAC